MQTFFRMLYYEVSSVPFAMIAAQLLNNDGQPLYGVYVIGHMRYFVVLEGKEYTVHRRGLNASTDELEQIFGVLQNTKPIIERWLASSSNDT